MSLQEAMHSLVQGIIASQEARGATLATLRDAARDQLRDVHSAHQAMAKRQRASLTRGHADLVKVEARRKSDVIDWIKDVASAHQAMAKRQRTGLAKARAGLAQDVGVWIKDVASAHQAMAKRQRTSLAKARAGLVQWETRRKSDVGAWIREVAADHAGAAREWQGMVATMRAPEADAAPVVKAPPRKAPASRAAAEEKGAEPVSLRDRVFGYLAGHPDGARLTEMEREFESGRFPMIKALRGLTDEGKVEKRANLYFAI